ncbi:hypothetical protein Y032_0359g3425 [Ancylostoma ceylanicum]|uniref:Uncharacterized protein n=1 Tax=Ancylostoma ceylanicum TaxID=53326 RepID=A0A016RWK8_9BILA|nr:hypothetical protein Y032_0359g3425 [Ancylostoma ceylanicum]
MKPITVFVQSFSKDGRLRDCSITAKPERRMRREHAPSERVEEVAPRFYSRNAMKPHAQSVYLFEKDCMTRTRPLSLQGR